MRTTRLNHRVAFTLIELLVVVAIIALLIAILVPSLTKARAASRLSVCGSNLHQVGLATIAYANEWRGFIPRGPDPSDPYDFSANTIATNQLWIGSGVDGPPPAHPRQYNGLGVLLRQTTGQARMLFCPADGNSNLQQELPRIGTDRDAYGSYLYRQLDELPPDASVGLLDRLGANEIGDERVRVEALALDTNSLGPGAFYHANHNALMVNVLFRDGAVRSYHNIANCLALPPEAFEDFSRIPGAIDQLLINADYAYWGRPTNAPRIPQ